MFSFTLDKKVSSGQRRAPRLTHSWVPGTGGLVVANRSQFIAVVGQMGKQGGGGDRNRNIRGWEDRRSSCERTSYFKEKKWRFSRLRFFLKIFDIKI